MAHSDISDEELIQGTPSVVRSVLPSINSKHPKMKRKELRKIKDATDKALSDIVTADNDTVTLKAPTLGNYSTPLSFPLWSTPKELRAIVFPGAHQALNHENRTEEKACVDIFLNTLFDSVVGRYSIPSTASSIDRALQCVHIQGLAQTLRESQWEDDKAMTMIIDRDIIPVICEILKIRREEIESTSNKQIHNTLVPDASERKGAMQQAPAEVEVGQAPQRRMADIKEIPKRAESKCMQLPRITTTNTVNTLAKRSPSPIDVRQAAATTTTVTQEALKQGSTRESILGIEPNNNARFRPSNTSSAGAAKSTTKNTRGLAEILPTSRAKFLNEKQHVDPSNMTSKQHEVHAVNTHTSTLGNITSPNVSVRPKGKGKNKFEKDTCPPTGLNHDPKLELIIPIYRVAILSAVREDIESGESRALNNALVIFDLKKIYETFNAEFKTLLVVAEEARVRHDRVLQEFRTLPASISIEQCDSDDVKECVDARVRTLMSILVDSVS